MINIKIRNEKWRVEINETWEFETRARLQEILLELLRLKDNFGKINNIEGNK
jgi:hypothetical protein